MSYADLLHAESQHTDVGYDKKRIVFFVKQGMDNFLNDIISEVSDEYEIKKVITTNYNQIDESMKWADICWFEWCDELIIYGSKLSIAKEKKIICRLHRYEVFTNYPRQVTWKNVDKLIIVTKHLEKILKAQIPDINKRVDIVTINNGVNLDKYKFEKRDKGFNIAYVGYIHSRKNPVLLLQIMNVLAKMDKRYKLYVAGKFQDSLIELYCNDQINKMDLNQNIIFQGWQNDIGNWLENKNYILSTSIHESFGYGIAEAMSRGIKPIIHNFPFADEIWSEKFMFNSIDEAVNMITENNYDSKEYRNFIQANYSLEKQLASIKSLLNDLYKRKLMKKEDDSGINNHICSFNYDGINIKFYLPYLNDWIQNIIYNSRNFYEIGMLDDIRNRIGEKKIIIDIGANIGNHTIYFSKICNAKKVISFEPQKNIFNILKKNVELNNCSEIVELHNIGLGKEYGHANVGNIDTNNYGGTSLRKNDNGDIEINTLDNIIYNKIDKVDMIKIDVEGMELEVLKGSINVLNRCKPIIYIEAATNAEFKNVSVFLERFNYNPVLKFNATPTYLFMQK